MCKESEYLEWLRMEKRLSWRCGGLELAGIHRPLWGGVLSRALRLEGCGMCSRPHNAALDPLVPSPPQ